MQWVKFDSMDNSGKGCKVSNNITINAALAIYVHCDYEKNEKISEFNELYD